MGTAPTLQQPIAGGILRYSGLIYIYIYILNIIQLLQNETVPKDKIPKTQQSLTFPNPPQCSHRLREVLPYLLGGSGGLNK